MSYEKIVLPNGIRVILAPMLSSEAVTTLVLCKAGSRYEGEVEAGISHYIEHMFFKGTAKRPTSLDLSQVVDGMGADFNAYTTKDHTGYYTKAKSNKIGVVLDLLSDIVSNSKLDGEEMEREKGVITQEIKMYEDNPLFHIDDMLEQTLFQGNTLGRTIAGSRETVQAMTVARLKDYMTRRYRPENMVIILAGKIEYGFMDKVKNYFGCIYGSCEKKMDREKKSEFEVFASDQKEPRFNILNKKTEQAQLDLGFHAYNVFDEKLPALRLLSVMLAGNISSRLFVRIREKMGLCYFIRSYVEEYQDTGYFSIHTGLDKNNIPKAVSAISEELARIKEEKVTEKELQMAKDYISGKFALRLEDSAQVADFYGNQELLEDRILTPEEKVKEIEKVTADEVLKVAKDILNLKDLSVAVIGDKILEKNVSKNLNF